MNSRPIPLRRFSGKGGLIGVLEKGRELPFEVNRVFYIHEIDELAVRGLHANRNLEEVIIALRGSCRMTLHDGRNEETVMLDDPELALYIGPLTWKVFDRFTPDCLLLVMASLPYEESDHLTDFQAFLKEVGES